MIQKIDKRLRKTNETSIFHDSRKDVRILMQFCNLLIEKVNELIDEINRMSKKDGDGE